jgi:TolA-binding protein
LLGERNPERLWKLAMLAALFALHPLRVESVSWVSERKDLLSGLFFFLLLIGYGRYVRRPSPALLYAGVALPLLLGLMSKPMLVTVPLVLLLLDFWPLRRVQLESRDPAVLLAAMRPLVVEKLPLFVIVILSAVVTFLAQADSGSVSDLVFRGAGPRLANAFLAVSFYLQKLAVPTGLAAFYPHPGDIQLSNEMWARAVPGIVVFVALAAVAYAARRSAPYLTVGVAWLLVMLLPVIGFVQVGAQGWADRYSYLTLIGPCMALIWGVAALLHRATGRPHAVLSVASIAFGVLVLALFASLTAKQIETWKDRESVWLTALERVPRNYLAAQKIGALRYEQRRHAEALEYFELADGIIPEWSKNQLMLGLILSAMKEHERAKPQLEAAMADYASNAQLHYSLGIAAAAAGERVQAVRHFEDSVARAPDNPVYAFKLGKALAAAGRMEDALGYLERASAQLPDDLQLRMVIAEANAALGRSERAIEIYREVLGRDPQQRQAREALERLSPPATP